MNRSMMLLALAVPLASACEQPGDTGDSGWDDDGSEIIGDTTEDGIPIIKLDLVAQGFVHPVALVPIPNEPPGTMLVVDQTGLGFRLKPDRGVEWNRPYLDVRDALTQLDPSYDERGLLDVAFHPDFAENGRMFLYYSAPPDSRTPAGYSHVNVLAEYIIQNGDFFAGHARELLRIQQPFPNHNGGEIEFGPDNMLYVGLGDGGNKNDIGPGHPELGNGQDRRTLHGSILRFDVNADPALGAVSPGDNPFVIDDTAEGAPEIWAYGLRNPARFSFDSKTGDLFVADPGQVMMEEINIVQPGGNYGWNVKEGTLCFNPANEHAPFPSCSDQGSWGEPLLDPVLTFPNSEGDLSTMDYESMRLEDFAGAAVVGGYMYRGFRNDFLRDHYIFGVWSRTLSQPMGRLAMAHPTGDGRWEMAPAMVALISQGNLISLQPDLGAYLLGFGQDHEGELYVLTSGSAGPTGNTGTIWKIVD